MPQRRDIPLRVPKTKNRIFCPNLSSLMHPPQPQPYSPDRSFKLLVRFPFTQRIHHLYVFIINCHDASQIRILNIGHNEKACFIRFDFFLTSCKCKKHNTSNEDNLFYNKLLSSSTACFNGVIVYVDKSNK